MNDLVTAVDKVLDWWEFSGSQLEGKDLMGSLSIEVEKVREFSNGSTVN
tara:strand:- start:4247 stop:4393 length:147 start_codon:yes stop_codon:yes gene_type:complete